MVVVLYMVDNTLNSTLPNKQNKVGNKLLEGLFSLVPVFPVLDVEPRHKFKIIVKTEGAEPYDEIQKEAAEIILNFEYTPTYPDEPPIMEVVPVENIEDEELTDLRERLQEQVCMLRYVTQQLYLETAEKFKNCTSLVNRQEFGFNVCLC